MRLICAVLAVFSTLAFPVTTWAHGVDLFARVEGTQLVGSMNFAGGTPVSMRPVKAFAPDGELLGETVTDEAGNFTMPIRAKVRHRLIGEAGEGHRGLFTVPESEILQVASEGDTPSGMVEGAEDLTGTIPVTPQAVEAAVARQLGPLRDQLHAHEKKVRLQDAIGGIGYIFGMIGFYVLIKQRLSRRDSR